MSVAIFVVLYVICNSNTTLFYRFIVGILKKFNGNFPIKVSRLRDLFRLHCEFSATFYLGDTYPIR